MAPAPPPPAEGELVGRGRQKGAPGAIAREGKIKLVDAGNGGLKCKKHMGVLTFDRFMAVEQFSLHLQCIWEASLFPYFDKMRILPGCTALWINCQFCPTVFVNSLNSV